MPETPLASRIAAVSSQVNPPEKDNFTGKKICHRFFIPFDVQTPQQGLQPNSVNIKVDAQIANVSCLGIRCALWNDEAKECHDVTALKAQPKIASILEAIDGYNRSHNQEG